MSRNLQNKSVLTSEQPTVSLHKPDLDLHPAADTIVTHPTVLALKAQSRKALALLRCTAGDRILTTEPPTGLRTDISMAIKMATMEKVRFLHIPTNILMRP